MDKLNIAELLKDCPSGMELDCTMYEDVYFLDIDIKSNSYLIRITTPCGIKYLDKYGCYTTSNKAKCVIFPKGKTTWKGFHRPFKDGDIVCNIENAIIIYKKVSTKGYCGSFASLDRNNIFIPHYLAYLEDTCRFATEDEKQKLFDAIKANGYKWNSETKTSEKLIQPKFKVGDKIKLNNSTFICTITDLLKDRYRATVNSYDLYEIEFERQDAYKLVPNKFDITTFKPFDKVLVRCSELEIWHISFFEKYNRKYSRYPFVCLNGNKYSQCIPYKDNEHLLDTADNCDEYYKTW